MRFAELWLSYAESVVPRSASYVQRQETRRAFYAGANALFGAVLAGLSDGTEPTEADMRALDELNEELQEFARDVAAGKA